MTDIETTNIEIDISLTQALFEQTETLARAMNISRSQLFVLAVEDFLRRYQNRQLLEQINQAYADGLDAEEQEWLEQVRRHHRRLVEGEW